MMFIGNLTYVAIAVVGGLRVASGSMSLGDVQAFIQYSRQFTQPLTQLASMANVLQSGSRFRGTGFRVPGRRRAVPGPGNCRSGCRIRAAGWSSRTSRSATTRRPR